MQSRRPARSSNDVSLSSDTTTVSVVSSTSLPPATTTTTTKRTKHNPTSSIPSQQLQSQPPPHLDPLVPSLLDPLSPNNNPNNTSHHTTSTPTIIPLILPTSREFIDLDINPNNNIQYELPPLPFALIRNCQCIDGSEIDSFPLGHSRLLPGFTVKDGKLYNQQDRMVRLAKYLGVITPQFDPAIFGSVTKPKTPKRTSNNTTPLASNLNDTNSANSNTSQNNASNGINNNTLAPYFSNEIVAEGRVVGGRVLRQRQPVAKRFSDQTSDEERDDEDDEDDEGEDEEEEEEKEEQQEAITIDTTPTPLAPPKKSRSKATNTNPTTQPIGTKTIDTPPAATTTKKTTRNTSKNAPTTTTTSTIATSADGESGKVASTTTISHKRATKATTTQSLDNISNNIHTSPSTNHPEVDHPVDQTTTTTTTKRRPRVKLPVVTTTIEYGEEEITPSTTAITTTTTTTSRPRQPTKRKHPPKSSSEDESEEYTGPKSLTRRQLSKLERDWALESAAPTQSKIETTTRSRGRNAPVFTLFNLGNSCFINSLMQAFVHLPMLALNFIEKSTISVNNNKLNTFLQQQIGPLIVDHLAKQQAHEPPPQTLPNIPNKKDKNLLLSSYDGGDGDILFDNNDNTNNTTNHDRQQQQEEQQPQQPSQKFILRPLPQQSNSQPNLLRFVNPNGLRLTPFAAELLRLMVHNPLYSFSLGDQTNDKINPTNTSPYPPPHSIPNDNNTPNNTSMGSKSTAKIRKVVDVIEPDTPTSPLLSFSTEDLKNNVILALDQIIPSQYLTESQLLQRQLQQNGISPSTSSHHAIASNDNNTHTNLLNSSSTISTTTTSTPMNDDHMIDLSLPPAPTTSRRGRKAAVVVQDPISTTTDTQNNIGNSNSNSTTPLNNTSTLANTDDNNTKSAVIEANTALIDNTPQRHLHHHPNHIFPDDAISTRTPHNMIDLLCQFRNDYNGLIQQDVHELFSDCLHNNQVAIESHIAQSLSSPILESQLLTYAHDSMSKSSGNVKGPKRGGNKLATTPSITPTSTPTTTPQPFSFKMQLQPLESEVDDLGLFYGMKETTFICEACQHQRTRTEPFSALTVHVPQPEEKPPKVSKNKALANIAEVPLHDELNTNNTNNTIMMMGIENNEINAIATTPSSSTPITPLALPSTRRSTRSSNKSLSDIDEGSGATPAITSTNTPLSDLPPITQTIISRSRRSKPSVTVVEDDFGRLHRNNSNDTITAVITTPTTTDVNTSSILETAAISIPKRRSRAKNTVSTGNTPVGLSDDHYNNVQDNDNAITTSSLTLITSEPPSTTTTPLTTPSTSQHLAAVNGYQGVGANKVPILGLSSLLHTHFNPLQVEVKCDRCKHPFSQCTTSIAQPPQVLVVHAQRWRFTQQFGRVRLLKSQRIISIDNNIDISSLISTSTAENDPYNLTGGGNGGGNTAVFDSPNNQSNSDQIGLMNLNSIGLGLEAIVVPPPTTSPPKPQQINVVEGGDNVMIDEPSPAPSTRLIQQPPNPQPFNTFNFPRPPATTYTLYAIINHKGHSPNSGHYFADINLAVVQRNAQKLHLSFNSYTPLPPPLPLQQLTHIDGSTMEMNDGGETMGMNDDNNTTTNNTHLISLTSPITTATNNGKKSITDSTTTMTSKGRKTQKNDNEGIADIPTELDRMLNQAKSLLSINQDYLTRPVKHQPQHYPVVSPTVVANIPGNTDVNIVSINNDTTPTTTSTALQSITTTTTTTTMTKSPSQITTTGRGRRNAQVAIVEPSSESTVMSDESPVTPTTTISTPNHISSSTSTTPITSVPAKPDIYTLPPLISSSSASLPVPTLDNWVRFDDSKASYFAENVNALEASKVTAYMFFFIRDDLLASME